MTPAFNASFGGLFKSFFDVLPEETLTDMPVLIAATGGTERHSLVLEHALRPMFSYLRAIVSPTGVYAATDDFGASSTRGRSRSASTGPAPTSPGCSAPAASASAAAPSTRRPPAWSGCSRHTPDSSAVLRVPQP